MNMPTAIPDRIILIRWLSRSEVGLSGLGYQPEGIQLVIRNIQPINNTALNGVIFVIFNWL